MAIETLYTTLDVVRIAAVTPRELQWWDMAKLVSPARDGKKRLYTSEEVLLVMAIKALRVKGVPLDEIRAAMPAINLDRKRHELSENTFMIVGTQGFGGIFRHSCHVLEMLTDHVSQPIWAIDLTPLWTRLQEHSNIGAAK